MGPMRGLLVVLAVAAVACAPPGVTLGDDMPADLAEVVTVAFDEMVEELDAHTSCLDGLTVEHAWEMADRAAYDPDTTTIVLRVPATANELEFSLAHEIAHHLEQSCPAQEEIRPAFLSAQGLPDSTAWFEGDTWEETPSEQFATALGMVLTGGTDDRRRVPVTEPALEVVTDWVGSGR